MSLPRVLLFTVTAVMASVEVPLLMAVVLVLVLRLAVMQRRWRCLSSGDAWEAALRLRCGNELVLPLQVSLLLVMKLYPQIPN